MLSLGLEFAGALAFGRIPVIGRKIHVPESWRRFDEFKPDFRLTAILLSKKCHGAAQFLLVCVIEQRHLLAAPDGLAHAHHAPVRVDGGRHHLFLKILRANSSANTNGHRDVNATRASTIGVSFGHTIRGRRSGICHESLLATVKTAQACAASELPAGVTDELSPGARPIEHSQQARIEA